MNRSHWDEYWLLQAVCAAVESPHGVLVFRCGGEVQRAVLSIFLAPQHLSPACKTRSVARHVTCLASFLFCGHPAAQVLGRFLLLWAIPARWAMGHVLTSVLPPVPARLPRLPSLEARLDVGFRSHLEHQALS